ncbi:hypothetical protein [Variovorax terrae]|uniref:Uncharacterized protein n=1 Tax=Variovorax terrae TaxID=2923278 RepID=A0A9X2AN85_9BURK|nr:hypothetical protein [Variovorax terrae]MCJ0764538.1 hypothetical protein [Variovorax terrae]
MDAWFKPSQLAAHPAPTVWSMNGGGLRFQVAPDVAILRCDETAPSSPIAGTVAGDKAQATTTAAVSVDSVSTSPESGVNITASRAGGWKESRPEPLSIDSAPNMPYATTVAERGRSKQAGWKDTVSMASNPLLVERETAVSSGARILTSNCTDAGADLEGIVMKASQEQWWPHVTLTALAGTPSTLTNTAPAKPGFPPLTPAGDVSLTQGSAAVKARDGVQRALMPVTIGRSLSVHVENTPSGVVVWLGMHANDVVSHQQLPVLIAQLRQALAGEGLRLSKVICNGNDISTEYAVGSSESEEALIATAFPVRSVQISFNLRKTEEAP